MKSIFFLLFALLTVTTLAAVPHYDGRGIELPPGAHWEGNTMVLANDPTDEHDRAMSDYVARAQATELSNITSPLAKRGSWGPDQLAVDVRTGGDKQHVGTLRGKRLYNTVYSCLQLVGHQGNGDLKGWTGRNPEVCSPDRRGYFCAYVCRVPNIVYNAGKNKYATNAYLMIEVSWSELKEHDYPGIRELAYSFAAHTYMTQLEESENCYTTDFEHSRRTTMCNVPSNLLIVWLARGDAMVASRLNMVVSFNGKTTDGKVKCENNLDKIKKNFKENVRPKLAEVMKWPESKLDSIVLFNSCQVTGCFTIKKGYWPDHKWVEPEACVPPKHYVDL